MPTYGNGYRLPPSDVTGPCSRRSNQFIAQDCHINTYSILHNNLFSALHVFFADFFKPVGAVFDHLQRLLTVKQLTCSGTCCIKTDVKKTFCMLFTFRDLFVWYIHFICPCAYGPCTNIVPVRKQMSIEVAE
jgi:hypothetical protein